MSDEPEARMWDEERGSSGFYEPHFSSAEHLDSSPLLAEDVYTDVLVNDESIEHCHWKGNETPSAVAQLVTAIVLCGIFMICELFGGYLAGSLSVMSDAAHMLSDCGGFALALLAFKCAKRPSNKSLTYGYKRAEVLGAVTSVIMIWVLTAIFVYVAINRLRSGDYDIEPDTMMFVSGFGVVFNIILALVLHGCGSSIAHHHTHGGAPCSSHAHTHSHTPSVFNVFRRREKQNGLVNGEFGLRELPVEDGEVVVKGDRNINLRAALIHVIGDLIQSCGVLLASIIIKLYPEYKWVDPVCTFVFSVLVLITTYRVITDAVKILMQAKPKGFRYKDCVVALSSIFGVRHVHSLHVWALTTNHFVLTAHVVIDELTDPEQVLSACQKLARQTLKVQSATFQVERFRQAMDSCVECTSQPCLRP